MEWVMAWMSGAWGGGVGMLEGRKGRGRSEAGRAAGAGGRSGCEGWRRCGRSDRDVDGVERVGLSGGSGNETGVHGRERAAECLGVKDGGAGVRIVKRRMRGGKRMVGEENPG